MSQFNSPDRIRYRIRLNEETRLPGQPASEGSFPIDPITRIPDIPPSIGRVEIIQPTRRPDPGRIIETRHS